MMKKIINTTPLGMERLFEIRSGSLDDNTVAIRGRFDTL